MLPVSLPARAAEKQPIEVIEDNSFLIEEAYNQEPGVVQYSFSTVYNGDSRRRGWSFNFTQEWPVFFQDHQISYTVPLYHFVEGPDRIHGLGDITLNYRYQAFDEAELKPAFAPNSALSCRPAIAAEEQGMVSSDISGRCL